MSARVGSRQGLVPTELAKVLPREGATYFSQLNDLRFHHRAHADHTFLSPSNLIQLLAGAVSQRGSLDGDDRLLMQMQGIPKAAFDLREGDYSYLQVKAEGRVGSMPISEMPEWVPVAIELEEGFEAAVFGQKKGSHDPRITFSVDSDFQRLVNYATIIIAPNWFDHPSTERSVLDVVIGPPPYGHHSLSLKSKAVRRAKLKPGMQITVGELKAATRGMDILLGCHLKNLPGHH